MQSDESRRGSESGMSSEPFERPRFKLRHSSSREAAPTALQKDSRMMARKMSNAEPVKLPLRHRAVRAARSKIWTAAVSYKKSRSCMLFTSTVTLLSCVFYVAGTYLARKHAVVIVSVEAFFAAVFFVDYVLSVTAEAMWLSFVLSFEGIVDLLSIFPVFGAFYKWLFSLSFVRYLRLGKVTRVMQNHRLLDKIGAFNDVTVNACLLGLKITGLVLMTTAIILGTELAFKEEDPFDEDGVSTAAFSNDGTAMQWHDALYFTIVTLSTVGYGDVLPLQAFSRILVIIVIVFALTYVPLEVGNLIDIIGSRPKNRTGYSRRLIGCNLHVVLAMVPWMDDGHPEPGFNALSLRRIIDELCHEDHGVDNESLWVVVMAPCPPSAEVLSVIRSPRFVSRVIYYRGSVMDPVDMSAVCAEYADCIFLYPFHERVSGGSGGLLAGSSVATEERITLAAKSVQRYLDRTPTDKTLMRRVAEQSVMGAPCRTLVTVRELRSKEQLVRFGVTHVICHDELKMSMMACATLFPAFLPFAINAMRSSSDYVVAVNNVGEEVGVNRSPSADLAAAAAAASASSNTGAGAASGESAPGWLRDYKRGMEYEVYSLVVNVGKDSSLWGLTFAGAAVELYDESEGEVLLMAVVHDLRVDSAAAGSRDSSRDRAAESSAAERAGGGGGGGGGEGWERQSSRRGLRPVAADGARGRCEVGAGGSDGGEADSSFVHVAIFPGDGFSFVGECNVLVLAEDKARAEHYMRQLQKSSASAELRKATTKVEDGSSPERKRHHHHQQQQQQQQQHEEEDMEKGKDGGGGGDGPAADSIAASAASVMSTSSRGAAGEAGFSVSFGLNHNPGPVFARTNSDTAAAAPAATAAAAVAVAVKSEGAEGEEEEEKMESGGVLPAPPSPGVGGEPPTATSTASSSPPPVVATAAAASGGGSGEGEAVSATAQVAGSGTATATASTTSRGIERLGSTRRTSLLTLDEEEKQAEKMEAVREEMRTEDGVRWEEALEALTAATGQLDSLKSRWGAFTEARITEDPRHFFSEVQEARFRLGDALRVQAAAVPEDLENHVVIIGAHPRLQYYVVAMRRQQPDVAIIVVTRDKESFFDLREKVAGAKCGDHGLNITKIFSVCGESQNRSTFEKARVTHAETVLVVSDAGNDTDVLLVSFELEQMLSEIPPRDHAPKVLIDLHIDNSIYYCGNNLGRGGSSSSAFTRSGSSGRLKETSGLSTAGVWEWPLFAAGMVWTESIMEVFAVQTYFSNEFLAFFETLLQIRRPVLVGNELLVELSSQEEGKASPLPRDGAGTDASSSSSGLVEDEDRPLRTSPSRGGAEGKAAAPSGASGAAGGLGAGRTGACGCAGSSLPAPHRGQFDMLHVASRRFRGQRYDLLARELILNGAMPLGLYRPAGTKGNNLPYTQVNPSISERIVRGDIVFVLRSRSCSLVGSV